MPKIKVALASDFLKALDALPKSQKSKVHAFIDKFKENPRSPGINYEKIQAFKDPKLRSVRIDQAYRAIVLKPDRGNVYVLLWVDHHDKAYQWAENKVYDIHPETGSLQVIRAEERVLQASPDAEVGAEQTGTDEEEGLFGGIRDRELIRLGVPELLLPLVRSLETEDALDRASEYMPQEAYEALFLLAAGYSYEEVWRDVKPVVQSGPVDTEDYASALETPDSKRRFYVVEDDLELAKVLNAPLEQWRVFLHPSQQRLVEMEANGPVRVLGGAGTGKTVVAMHRAKRLAEEATDGELVLFTTFTRNLAADIQENLAKICSKDVLQRIEVVNLDQWVTGLLRKHGYEFEIDYGARGRQLWEDALNLAPPELDVPPAFYRDEWEQVIQPHGITALRDYLRVSRVGRGQPLSRKWRKEIWPVFDQYRTSLTEHGLKEREDALRDARLLLEREGDVLPYVAVVVDEAQDMGMQAFKLIRQMIPGGDQKNDLFIVGDAHQRIYRHHVVLSHCGVNIVGRGRKLRINYRTTEENRRWAVELLKGIRFDDLDGGVDAQAGYKSLLHGEDPDVHLFDTFSEEVQFLSERLRALGEAGETEAASESAGGDGSEAAGAASKGLRSTCVVARTHDLLKKYEGALEATGIPTYYVRRKEADDRSRPGLRLATMHRVKGLEFDRVFIVGVNDGMVPLEAAGGGADEVAEREREVLERALLYVAATRAKRGVTVTGHGVQSRFLAVANGDSTG